MLYEVITPPSHITTVMVKFTESIANIKKLSLEESLAELPFSYTLHGKKETIYPLYTTKQDEYLILHLISPDVIPDISFRITSYNVCYTKLLRILETIYFLQNHSAVFHAA